MIVRPFGFMKARGGGIVERVGNTYGSSAYSQTTAVTVPSGATLALIFTKNYNDPGSGTAVLGSVASTRIMKIGSDGSRPTVEVSYIKNPASGATTLYHGSEQGFSNIYNAFIAFYSGTSETPIKDYDYNTTGDDITGMTVAAGDMMAGIYAAIGGTGASATDDSQTQLYSDGVATILIAQKSGSGSFYYTQASEITSHRAIACILGAA